MMNKYHLILYLLGSSVFETEDFLIENANSIKEKFFKRKSIKLIVILENFIDNRFY